MKQKPIQEEHYKEMVWVNPTTEALRKKECLCLNCERMKPNQPDHCTYAQNFFEICQKGNIAMIILGCPECKPTRNDFLFLKADGIWINPTTWQLQTTEDLCLHCLKFRYCSLEDKLAKIWSAGSIILITTRCPIYSPK